MSTETRAAVAKALARPLEQRNGRWHCQVCDRGFETRQAIGPHQLQHRRQVGLAPPKGRQHALPGVVTCAMPSCHTRLGKGNYRRHLRQVHRLSPADAERTMHEHAAAILKAAPVPAITVDEPTPEPSVLTDLTGVDAAAGILNAARTDGLIPVGMLRTVVDWIGHTDRVLAELARLTNRDG